MRVEEILDCWTRTNGQGQRTNTRTDTGGQEGAPEGPGRGRNTVEDNSGTGTRGGEGNN